MKEKLENKEPVCLYDSIICSVDRDSRECKECEARYKEELKYLLKKIKNVRIVKKGKRSL